MLGFDARELTPLLIQRMTLAAVETCSFRRAVSVMRLVDDRPVSAKTTERVMHDVGWELAERRAAAPKTADALAQRPESLPDLAVVACGGGRVRTREPGHGPGVHSTTEGCGETTNACPILPPQRWNSATIPSQNRRSVSAIPSTWPRSPRPRPCRSPRHVPLRPPK